MSSRVQQIVGANALRSRSHNRQVVLGQVRAAGEIGRADIARASGLSTQAVSNIIADLLADNLIVEGGRRVPTRGLPVTLYRLNPDGGFAFGVEIRPNAVFAALLNFAGDQVFADRAQLTTSTQNTVLQTVLDLRNRAAETAGVPLDRILGAGIVMPGPFGATGIRDSGSDLSGWDDASPQASFQDALELPTFVENDANAAAMAERIKGTAKTHDLENYAFIYFGTGVGLGIVEHGRPLTGYYGNAGEIGHMPVPCAQGAAPLETLVSRLSVEKALADAGIQANGVDDLHSLFQNRNPALMKWIDTAIPPLAAAIGIVENLFDPETVILGGAMPDQILDHVIEHMTLPELSVANRTERTHPRVMRGSAGRMTATLGAAALVLNQAFTPKITVAG